MENQFIQIAALIGDPTRAKIMWTLMEGKAFTATELAVTSETSPQNVSMHLTKLVQANLLCVEKQGRHRYYTYSRKEIAYAIEAMANLTTKPHPNKPGIEEARPPIQHCRTCYDHLAGKVAVALTDSLLQQKIILARKNEFLLTKKGHNWFSELGLDTKSLKQQRRSFLRPCLDWSERRQHLAGSLAAALLDKMLVSDWIRKTKDSRAVIITSKGNKMFYEYFKLTL
jgi:DNA-binding transcriptional ArsR family regulator